MAQLFLLISIFFIAILFVVEILYFRIAEHFNIIDKPNERSSHQKVVLRGGGIIFVAAAWLWTALWGEACYPWFMAGLTLIAVVSFIDDIRSLPDSVRLFAQFSAVALMCQELDILHLHLWWSAVVVAVVGVGIINAYNFMDGINGITGAYSLAVLIPLLMVNRSIDIWLILSAIFAALVFCTFNFRKNARCFAGDVGSVSIAFIIVFVLATVIIQTGDWTYIIFLAVYGVDAVLTICHRILLHENLGQAHRKHAYQIMANELHQPHLRVATGYALLQLFISIGLIFLPVPHWLYAIVVILVLSAAYLLFIRKYYHLHREYLSKTAKKLPI